MAERTTVARPYAQAVFKRAEERGRLHEWSAMLRLATAVSANDAMQAVLDSTHFSAPQLAELFIEVCGDRLDAEGRNLIRTLAVNRRFALLPEITAIYETYRAEAESTIDAEMIAAYAVSEAERERIAAALKARLGRDVKLKISTDAALLGGAVIRAGDVVIDGSVRGKLGKLAGAMNH